MEEPDADPSDGEEELEMEPPALWYTDWPDPVLTLSGVAGREDGPPPLYSLVAS